MNGSHILNTVLASLLTLAVTGPAFAEIIASDARSVGPLNEAQANPFAHRDQIDAVSPYVVVTNDGKHTHSRLAGASVKFRATPGLTAEWLQRSLDKHQMMAGLSPAQVQGVSTVVRSSGDGFLVTMTTTNEAVAKEVLRRAEALIAK